MIRLDLTIDGSNSKIGMVSVCRSDRKNTKPPATRVPLRWLDSVGLLIRRTSISQGKLGTKYKPAV